MSISTLSKITVPLDSSQSASNQGLLMPKLQYRFRVSLENFGVSTPTTELTKQVVDITRPNLSFETTTIDVYNSKVYLAGNRESGVLAFGNEIPIYPAGGEARVAWPYQLEIYYIRDLEIPTLSRKVLMWKESGLTLDNEDLIEGVENLAIKIGIDSDFDGNVDIFENIQSSPTEWNAVEALEIYLLLRSAYPDANYVNNKTYSLPDGDFTPSLNQKHYRRLLLHSTILLRNVKLNRRAGV